MTKCNFTITKPRVKDTSTFIEAAKITHGETYSYSQSEYVDAKSRVQIFCEKHGAFWQRPSNHTKGRGCRECASENRKEAIEQRRLRNAKSFAEKSRRVHGEKFTYGKADYRTGKDKVLITCSTHGDFEQMPESHLQGAGCPSCAKLILNSAIEKQRSDAALSFIDKSNKKHGHKYGYAKTKYKNNRAKVVITCPCHGDFLQTPADHLSGNGCQSCAKEIISGWTRSIFIKRAKAINNGQATLYLIKCWKGDEIFYKIGITATSINNRFRNNREMPYDLEVVKMVSGEAAEIYNMEAKMHRMNKENHYTPKIPFGGSVLECFTEISQDTLFLLDAI